MRCVGVIVVCLILSTLVRAQSAPVALGPRVSGMFDVSFQPFAGAKQVDRQAVSELLRFERADKQWALVFDKAELPQAVPLRDTRGADGIERPGNLSAAINHIRANDPDADVLRTDVLDTGKLRIGVIVAHVKAKDDEKALFQEAIIEVTPRLYYSIVMRSPAPRKDLDKDAAVHEAADTFKAILDSIELVDLSKVRQDQEDRLFRTRALFVEWNRKKLISALKPELFLRVRKNIEPAGQWEDIGYAYIVEQPADAIPRAGAAPGVTDPLKAVGLRVGTRLRTMNEPGKPVDLESWMFVSFDRAHEVWSNITLMPNPSPKNDKDQQIWTAEVGASDLQRERVFDKNLSPEDFKKAEKQDQNPYRMVDKYRLTVRTESRNAVAQPLQRELPPFYLPQALGAILPRLLPLNHPNGYLFAGYVSDSRNVMLRYVDVGQEATVVLGDKSVRAIPVIERLGAEGLPTTHYMSPDGEYLGSINQVSDKQRIEILPADRDTLLKIWKDANLAAPEATK